jgi:hypothetical protein
MSSPRQLLIDALATATIQHQHQQQALPIDIMYIIASYTLVHRLYIVTPYNWQIASITLSCHQWRHSSPMPFEQEKCDHEHEHVNDNDVGGGNMRETDTHTTLNINTPDDPLSKSVGIDGGCIVNDNDVLISSAEEGYEEANNPTEAYLSHYNISSNEWSLRRRMPQLDRHHGKGVYVSLNGGMSVISDISSTIDTYYHSNNTWCTNALPSLPMKPDGRISAIVHQGRLYFVDARQSLVCQVSSIDRIGNGTIQNKWYRTKQNFVEHSPSGMLNVVDTTNSLGAVGNDHTEFALQNGVIIVASPRYQTLNATDAASGLSIYSPNKGQFIDLSAIIRNYITKFPTPSSSTETASSSPSSPLGQVYRRTVMLPTGVMIMFLRNRDREDQIWALNLKYIITTMNHASPSSTLPSSTWIWKQLPSLETYGQQIYILGVIESLD